MGSMGIVRRLSFSCADPPLEADGFVTGPNPPVVFGVRV